MTQHTPGPWSRFDLGKWQGVEIGETPTGEQPCIVHWSGFDACGLSQPEYAANARLIAAAPELLDALEKAAKKLTLDECIECGIEAAITKARNA